LGAAAFGSAIGLGLSAAYLAGAHAPGASPETQSQRMASAAALGFSEAALQQNLSHMDAGALAIAQRHDPRIVAGSAQRDRQAAEFAARLARSDPGPSGPSIASLMLRPVLGPGQFDAYDRFGFTSIGALDSARDLECLTQAVYYEARGESAEGQRAVAQVVLNRVRHPAFPKTVCAVVYQGASVGHGCQFSFACDGSMHDRREPAAWRRAEGVAAQALGGYVMAQVGKSTHFHALRLAPDWGQTMVRVAQVGLHVFYRFGRNTAIQAPADGVETAVAPAPPAAKVAASAPVMASLLPLPSEGGPSGAEAKAPVVAKDAAAAVTPAAVDAPAAKAKPDAPTA
jgi:spore germination cell wall hydrolase CwlJ-like protein